MYSVKYLSYERHIRQRRGWASTSWKLVILQSLTICVNYWRYKETDKHSLPVPVYWLPPKPTQPGNIPHREETDLAELQETIISYTWVSLGYLKYENKEDFHFFPALTSWRLIVNLSSFDITILSLVNFSVCL